MILDNVSSLRIRTTNQISAWISRPERRRFLGAALLHAESFKERLANRNTWGEDQRKIAASELKELIRLVQIASAGETAFPSFHSIDQQWLDNVEKVIGGDSGEAEALPFVSDSLIDSLRLRLALLGARAASKAPPIQNQKINERSDNGRSDEARSLTSTEFTANEAAVYGSLVDKFYGSPALKIASAMLVAAAAFAIGGTIVIGTQTVDVRDQLENRSEEAKKDIEALRERTHTIIDAQTKELLDQDNKLAQLRSSLTFEVNQAIGDAQKSAEESKKALEKNLKDFKDQQDDLKREALIAVIASIRQDLKTHEEALKISISAPLVEMRDKDLLALQDQIGTLKTNAGQAERVITAAVASLNESGDLSELVDKIEDLQANAAKIQEAVDTADQLVSSLEASKSAAETARDAAKSAATDAQSQREALADEIQMAREGTDEQLVELGRIQSRVAQSKADLDQVVPKIRELQDQLASAPTISTNIGEVERNLEAERTRLSALHSQIEASVQVESDLRKELDALTPKVNDLKSRVELSSEPPQPPLKLSRDRWKEIQQALLDQGIDPKGIDGKPGNGTQAAIRAFQTRIGELSTGLLTPHQIEILLGNKVQTTSRPTNSVP